MVGKSFSWGGSLVTLPSNQWTLTPSSRSICRHVGCNHFLIINIDMDKFVQTVCIAILNSDYEKRSHASSLFPPVIRVGPIYRLVSAKYQLKNIDIGKNIGIYRPKYQLSARYRPK